jgi:hypothetical protein
MPFSRAAAFHEAGHAAVRLAIGKPAMAVEIRAGGTGLTHGSGETLGLSTQGEVWDEVAYCLAGPFAEARVSKRSRIWVMLRRGLEDNVRAKLAIAWLVKHRYATNEHMAWERAYQTTDHYLLEHWALIDRIANALLKGGRVEAQELHAIWHRH